MFSSALPMLPPPTSLLPSLHNPPLGDHGQSGPGSLHHHHHHHNHHHQRRNKHGYLHSRTASQLLSLDERTISQRKLAIAMYGYSWLKPAGCNKTMLGRREEELEREEVERQLREVELQERLAVEGETEAEAERLAEMRRLELEAEERGDGAAAAAATGGGELVDGERNLDDDIPEAEEDVSDVSDVEDGEDDIEGVEDDMDADLDDGVPDADAGTDVESSWVYNTNRDPDSEAEEHEHSFMARRQLQQQRRRNIRAEVSSSPYTGLDNAIETETMVNAILDEDELGDMAGQRDLDDDVPDMDAEDIDMDMDMDDQDHDLDDDVPEAEVSGEWQHTDTELEESDMDISLLPGGQQSQHQQTPILPGSARSEGSEHSRSSGMGPGTTHEDMRRSSGNIMMPPPPRVVSSQQQGQSSESGHIHQTRSNRRPEWITSRRGRAARNVTPQTRGVYNTPGMNTGDSISNSISTDRSSIVRITGAAPMTDDNTNNTNTAHQQRSTRTWLNPAGARRNLFGGSNHGSSNTSLAATNRSNGSDIGSTSESSTNGRQQQQSLLQTSGGASVTAANAAASSSSGGRLFTPSPRLTRTADLDAIGEPRNLRHQTNPDARRGEQQTTDDEFADGDGDEDDDNNEQAAPTSRTRSGRILSGIGRRIGGRR